MVGGATLDENNYKQANKIYWSWRKIMIWKYFIQKE